ncbi:hypothetical protein [Robiginitalea sp. SC105]|uniref:hypothetical protein n=1 Tax=Robiginitalea sp. SC105 TaxID=2762332 RepID=UPI00163A47DC|nr:hypothetical protein [Robiginitalea sp. SC105]MBC2839285.1 hypothetical protein [Robiginitalea sp. SC105]
MKIATLVLGFSLLGSSVFPLSANTDCHNIYPGPCHDLVAEMNQEFEASLRAQSEVLDLDARTLETVEAEADIDLGFDPSAYLPEDFDAYAGKLSDHEVPALIKVEETVDLGFDTTPYLPAGFDPYLGQSVTDTRTAERIQ